MFKFKNIVLLGFISSIILFNCEGRKSQNIALEESIKEFKSNFSIEKNTFIPEQFTEVKVDSTLTNGFRIKARHFTDMKNAHIISKIEDYIKTKTHYRNWITDLEITFNNKIILNKRITNNTVKEFIKFKKEYKDYRYSHIDLIQEKSTSDSVNFSLYAQEPKTNRFIVCDIKLFKSGNFELQNIQRL